MKNRHLQNIQTAPSLSTLWRRRFNWEKMKKKMLPHIAVMLKPIRANDGKFTNFHFIYIVSYINFRINTMRHKRRLETTVRTHIIQNIYLLIIVACECVVDHIEKSCWKNISLFEKEKNFHTIEISRKGNILLKSDDGMRRLFSGNAALNRVNGLYVNRNDSNAYFWKGNILFNSNWFSLLIVRMVGYTPQWWFETLRYFQCYVCRV